MSAANGVRRCETCLFWATDSDREMYDQEYQAKYPALCANPSCPMNGTLRLPSHGARCQFWEKDLRA